MINSERHYFTINYCLNRKLTLDLIYFRIPLIHFDWFVLRNSSNYILHPKVISFFYRNISAVFKWWVYKGCITFNHKNNFFYFISFNKNVLFRIILPRFKKRTCPSYEGWTLISKKLNLRVSMLIDIEWTFYFEFVGKSLYKIINIWQFFLYLIS